MAWDMALTGLEWGNFCFWFSNSSISILLGITTARDSISSAIDLLRHEQSDLFGSFVILIPEWQGSALHSLPLNIPDPCLVTIFHLGVSKVCVVQPRKYKSRNIIIFIIKEWLCPVGIIYPNVNSQLIKIWIRCNKNWSIIRSGGVTSREWSIEIWLDTAPTVTLCRSNQHSVPPP